MKKIFEAKLNDFLKGISAQYNFAMGGLWQLATGFDPFEQIGVALPSLAPTTVTPAATPLFMTNWNKTGVAYEYIHTASTLLQVLKDSPYTITDVSAQINVASTARGGIMWKNGYVYANTSIWYNALPVASGSNVQIKAGMNGSLTAVPFCVGADGNLYVGEDSKVGILTVTTGTVGNTNTFNIDANFTVKALVNDGRYLVILADNNNDPATGVPTTKVGKYRCRVYFWDMVKATADVIYDVDSESYITAAALLDGAVYFFGYNGLYVCNSATPPRLLRPLVSATNQVIGKPANCYQLTVRQGSLLWVDGFNVSAYRHKVYAYGNPFGGQQKIYYSPYIDSGADATLTCIVAAGDQVWVGCDTPAVYVHNPAGGSRGPMRISSINTQVLMPHKYGFTKVVLIGPLTSGQTVSCMVSGGADQGTSVSASETISYSATRAKSSFIFRRKPGTQEKIENLYVDIQTTGGAGIARVATYATPLDDSNEEV